MISRSARSSLDDHAVRDGWHKYAKEQVRYRRERENKHWPSRMKLRARRSHIYSNAGGGRWRGSGSCPSIEPPRTPLSPRMEKNGLAQIPRNAPAQIPYVAWSGSFRPARHEPQPPRPPTPSSCENDDIASSTSARNSTITISRKAEHIRPRAHRQNPALAHQG